MGEKNKMGTNEITLVSFLLWRNGLLTLPLTNKLTTIFSRQECCPKFIVCAQISIKIPLSGVGREDVLSYCFRA